MEPGLRPPQPELHRQHQATPAQLRKRSKPPSCILQTSFSMLKQLPPGAPRCIERQHTAPHPMPAQLSRPRHPVLRSPAHVS